MLSASDVDLCLEIGNANAPTCSYLGRMIRHQVTFHPMAMSIAAVLNEDAMIQMTRFSPEYLFPDPNRVPHVDRASATKICRERNTDLRFSPP